MTGAGRETKPIRWLAPNVWQDMTPRSCVWSRITSSHPGQVLATDAGTPPGFSAHSCSTRQPTEEPLMLSRQNWRPSLLTHLLSNGLDVVTLLAFALQQTHKNNNNHCRYCC